MAYIPVSFQFGDHCGRNDSRDEMFFYGINVCVRGKIIQICLVALENVTESVNGRN